MVQLTSVAGLTSMAGFGAYSAAKHALEAMSEALAGEVARSAGEGIRSGA